MTWTLKHPTEGTEREFSSRAEAEEEKKDLEQMLGEELELHPPDEPQTPTEIRQDGGSEPVAVESEESNEPDTIESEATDSLPDQQPGIEEDPVDWLPTHFIDHIQGVPTVNRKGYAVIASKYGVSVKAEPITLPSETDFEFAEFRAVATTKDGTEYTGFGSAHIARMDGDDAYLLGELAETRALKRAVSWATGIGMTAIEELQHEP